MRIMTRYTIGLMSLFFAFTFILQGQSDSITLEALWKDGAYYPNYIPGFTFMEDGKHYSRKEDDQIVKYDLTTGDKVDVIWDAAQYKGVAGFDGQFGSYELVDGESKLLITDNVKSIYRRSFSADYFLFDLESKKLSSVYDKGMIQYATLSPTANHIAFVYENNVYIKDLVSNAVSQVTTDGEKNRIINGAADWVYEEEFAFAKAFFWNVDGTSLAYMKFDETAVNEFTMTLHHNEMYPIYETFKYPKVGEQNATVSAHIYNLKKANTTDVDLPHDSEMYIPRLKWTQDPNNLCVFWLNRHQNDLTLYLADRKKGKTKELLKETNKYYVDITDDLTFTEDGEYFIWTSEQSGYNHIYLYDMKGELVKPLTSGDRDVVAYQGMDEINRDIYYRSIGDSAMDKGVYKVNIDSGQRTNLTPMSGTSRAQFSGNYDYFVNTHSTINTAQTYTVYDKLGKLIRVIEDNSEMADIQKSVGTQPAEFFSFTQSSGVELNGYMIKPAGFDASKQYPVFMYLYGGPGSQQVTDAWKGQNYWWFQHLASQGYLIAVVDNRGTGGRGQEFKKMTYMQLGKYETEDQIDAAKYLGSLPYTDANRIGIFGWSYGGYMSSLCLLKGNDVFKAAIAVAPVTNWKWYDSIYTERYMRTYGENTDGYDDNSPINFADRLRGNYLLIHGMADDNVHFQHTAEMANALIKANKQFDTYYYPNRNHGIYGDNARLHLYTKMTEFLMEKL